MHALATVCAPPVQLFCDARGVPPRVAAVLLADGKCWYIDLAPSESALTNFRHRNDKQIMSLELLSIALGLSSFAHLLRGRKVRVWSDNAGAEATTRKGSARQFDHTCLVHCLWLRAAQLHIHLRVDRVPTDDNIADLPSRECYDLVERLGGVRIEAKLDDMFCAPEAWSSLSAESPGSSLVLTRRA